MKIVILDGALEKTPQNWNAYLSDLISTLKENNHQVCHFKLKDVRKATYPPASYDAALFLYGQLAVCRRQEAAKLLRDIATALKPGSCLAVEMLDQERVDKKNSLSLIHISEPTRPY